MKAPRQLGRAIEVVRHPVAQNAIALGWVQLATFVLPLVTLPYLARTLGPRALGVLVFAQAFSGFVYLLSEYGFGLSAGRDIAARRGDEQPPDDIVAAVQGAKLALFALTVLLGAVALLLVPNFRDSPEYLLLAVADAIALGLSPLWYFRGIERLRLAATLNLLARVVATVGVILLVKSRDQGWIVLAVSAATDLVASAVSLAVMYRQVSWERPTWTGTRQALRDGWHLFLYNASLVLYTTANAFVLGLLAPATQVAFFGGAERMSRAATRMVGPVSEALFPRVTYLLAQGERQRARFVAGRSLLYLTGLGLLAAAALALLAPWIVGLVLGDGYGAAVPVLRVLALLIPLIAASNVLGIQWAIPLGFDKQFTRVILLAGPLNLAMLAVLVPLLQALGAAVAVVVTEAFVVAGLAWMLAGRHELPLGFHSPAAERVTET